MDSYSISFTLSKASVPHGANPMHNNRYFVAANVDRSRVCQNTIYVRQDVETAYRRLFDEAVDAYNAKQSRPCRRIRDYYTHISESKREEAFYEIVVQFGDIETAPCGSARGEAAQKMLDEYMRDFQRRNPNLHVFNAVLHMDETSPHLHIDFIPFYAKGQKENQLVAWEQAEREEMERILHRNGYVREDKQARHAHMTVGDFKRRKELERVRQVMQRRRMVTEEEKQVAYIRMMKQSMASIEHENRKLKTEISTRCSYRKQQTCNH